MVYPLQGETMTIHELRQRTGLSQSEFCDKFHIGIRALQAWEQGWRNCPPYVVYLIERVLDYESAQSCGKEQG